MIKSIHTFDSTGEAYDACQCDESIKNGDILHVPSEGVVGVADTWPVAVTIAFGKLHTPAEGWSLGKALADREAYYGIADALVFAFRQGYTTRD